MFVYEIVFNLPVEKKFTYKSDRENLVHKRVLVPFRNKNQIGLVLYSSLSKEFNYPLKSVTEVIDEHPHINQDQLDLAEWISYFYLCSLGEALGLFISFNQKKLSKKKN